MRETITVSIPRKPIGLMNLEGKTIFSPRRSVRSSLSQVHFRRAIIGSRTPFFLLLGAPNSRFSDQLPEGAYLPVCIDCELDFRKRIQSEVIGRSGDSNSVKQSILASVAWALATDID